MKNSFILFFLVCTLVSIAQVKQKKQVKTVNTKGKTHVPASKTLVGIWRQTGMTNPNDGEVYGIRSGNYKVINPDGTFYTFVTWNMQSTTIGQYGSYTITSDSTLVEHIVQHAMVPKLNGKDCMVRYKIIDENTMMSAWSFDNKKWVEDRMTRLSLSESEQKPTTNTSMILGRGDFGEVKFVTKSSIAAYQQ
jgi:hypothetical protein